jgi:hypothetical protein
LLRTLVVEGQVENVRGEVGEGNLAVVLHKSNIILRGQELVATGIVGTYGTKSQIADGVGKLKRLFSEKGPSLDLRLVADLDLQEGLEGMLAAVSQSRLTSFSQYLAQPQGRVLVRLQLSAPELRGAIRYDGEATLRQIGFDVPAWQAKITDLSGTVQLSHEALTTGALTLRVGESWIQVQGGVRNYLWPHRSADLRLTFTEARDYDFSALAALLLPAGLILPQGGVLSGQMGVTLLAENGEIQTSGEVRLSRVRLSPLSFLRPLEVRDGRVRWQGQRGTFTVRQGRLPGGDFTGRGQFRSFTPLDLEVSADFADLDLESALALDKPAEEDSGPQDTSTVVRVDLSWDRLTYKTLKAEDVRFACHWHDRQADLRISEAKVAGGNLQGKAVLWPDPKSLFIAPQLTGVDVQRFFSALGKPTNVLTGTLKGSGQIHISDWHQWDSPAHWDGTLSLTVADGVAQQLPILVRLWSAVSLQELLSFQLPSLPSEGLAFSLLTGDFALEKGLATTHNLSLDGSAIRLNASGGINLAQRTVDLKMTLVPLHGITSRVAKVPLAGGVLARGADRLTTPTFRVNGPYDNPRVTPLLVNRGKP